MVYTGFQFLQGSAKTCTSVIEHIKYRCVDVDTTNAFTSKYQSIRVISI